MLFLAGGKTDTDPFSNRAFVYYPGEDDWTEVEPLAVGTNGHSCGAVGHSVFVSGGYADGWTVTERTEVFSLDTMTWERGPEMPNAVAYGVTVEAEDLTYIVVGGITADGEETDTIQVRTKIRRLFQGASNNIF